MSLLEPLIGSLLRRLRSDVHVFSDSLLSVGSHHWKRSMGNQDLRSKGPDDIIHQYDITGRPVQFHWHIFSGHTTIKIMREIQTFTRSPRPCDYDGRFIFMSMFNDIEYWRTTKSAHVLQTQQRLLQYAKLLKLGVFLWTWTRKNMVSLEHRWDYIGKKMT